MAYQSISFVFGEQPSAAKWNILGSNDASFNDGTGIGTDAIRASSMYYGMVRNRQGSTTGDATWSTAGTNNTATDAKDVFIQAGSNTSSSGAVTVTFPSAFTQIPLVFTTVLSTSNGFWSQTESGTLSTTQFAFTCWSATGSLASGKTVYWLAVGQ